MTNDLFLAILAMDAYNRTGPGSTPRGLVILPASSQIGTAVLDRVGEDTETGFFAQSYIWGDQKVISYRGTDTSPSAELGKDALYGWPTGIGVFANAQATRAAQFYQEVVGNGNTGNLTLNDLYAANIALTGHSLGGGLAGLMASIYGQQYARVFDSMAFALAASNLVDRTQTTVIDELGTIGVLDPVMRQLYFLNGEPNPVNSSGVSGYAVQGQALGTWQTPTYVPPFDPGFTGILGPIDRHSQSLLVLLMYAAQTGGIGSDWRSVSQYVLPKLFADDIAVKLGLQTGGETGTDSASGKMRTMIAYSAIDDGTFVFGNTGIRALFNDAGELGRLNNAVDTADYLKDPFVQRALADIVAEYAGLLARNKDIVLGSTDGNTGHEKGALYYDQNANRLIGDFARDLWKKVDDGNVGPQVDIIGKKTLTDAASQFNGVTRITIDDAVNRLWDGNTDHVIKLVAATKDISVTLDAVADAQIGQQPNPLPIDGAMLVGAGGNDRIVGAKGNDLLIGGKGEDTFIGGRGDDLMFGGADKDTFKGYDQTTPPPQDDAQATGYEGNDWMDGEAGEDTVDYSRLPNAVMYTISEERIGSNVVVKITDPATETTPATTDYLISVEKVKLTDKADTIKVDFASVIKDPGVRTTIDGDAAPAEATMNGALGDRLDFSASTTPALLGSAKDQTSAEIFTKWQPITQDATFVYNVIKPSGAATGAGLTDATGVRFTNFEHVTGSANDDVMGLWWLNPGGELTPEQEQALQAAQNITVSFASGNPAQIGAALDARMEQARLIPQNQQDVVLEGGAGKDIILGTRTGADRIYGGDGNDKLYAGGFTSEIYGGAGTDYVQGGGFKSQLYGGDGSGTPDTTPDVFGLSNHSFVMDATSDDFVMWGSFLLTGGVQQWWMEKGWAYWTPFTSIVSTISPLGFLDTFGALSAILDSPTMGTVRYALAGSPESPELVVQFARGRGGQAVIENYNLDIDTGKATGHIVAFQQVQVAPGSVTLQQAEASIRLLLKAGFGGDPLVLDLDGDGLELTSRTNVNVHFDVDNDNFAERTAWVKGDDGFLARDLNGNGKIDNIGELFGDAATSGFTALDSNGDAADCGMRRRQVLLQPRACTRYRTIWYRTICH